MTLYRKYRPQTFAELVDQNHIKITLQNQLETGKVGHAYLFTGPRGLGKTTTARLLAKALNCLNRKEGEYEPCNKCDSCKEIIEGRALDLVEIDAASHTGVDNVRENIIAAARTAPSSRKYKIFVIDEVHMLSISAFNALLKTLEEPPFYVVFILATTEVHKVPETIISRCQRFDFKRIPVNDIVKRLKYICEQEKIEVEEDVLKNIAHRSEGSIRDAESVLGQLFALGEKKINKEIAELVIPRSDFLLVFDFFELVAQKRTDQALEKLNKLVEEGVGLKEFLEDLIEMVRKILLIKINPKLNEYTHLNLDETLEKKLIEAAQKYPLAQLIRIIETFLDYKTKIALASLPQLPLELAVFELTKK